MAGATGGPALRELTFHQRAGLLKSLGHDAARAPRGALRPVRPHRRDPRATPSSTSTAASACCSATPAGPSANCRTTPSLPRAPVEPLGKGGHFVGQHILTPLHGVAVQINAFNFPVWGPLEKFAPALIAGVPSLVKPATQTAYLTARLVELIVDSGLLPGGLAPAGLRQRRRPVRPPDRTGPGGLHRVGGDRPAAARPPGRHRAVGAVQCRGGLAELLDPRPRRQAGHARSSTCTSGSWSPR